MSIFITACMASLFFRLMPPESYITPLPTIARCPVGFDGRYESLIMRGGSVLPALTPSSPPQPRAARDSASNTSTSRPDAAATAMATSAMRLAVRCPGGVLARSRASWAAPAVADATRSHRARRLRRASTRRRATISRSAGRRHVLLEGAVAVPGEEDALDDGLAGDVGGHGAEIGERRGQHARAWPPRGRTPRRRRAAGAAVSVAGSPTPTATTVGPSRRRHDERLADLAVEPGRRERRPVEADLPRHRALDADRHADGVGRRRARTARPSR